ncbi:MAG: gliding motility-associated C-terminal domain-containing protein [Bacteroidetes bacterium]|nr:gliding motility-associated C-terminal domain-containing protein [Bacteroidota bacterium]
MTKRILLSFLLLIILYGLRASPVIDSIVATQSDCRDNGQITVYAHSTSALHYAITAGPQLRAQQLSRTFSSLPRGTYIVEVGDAASTSSRQVTVGGNYTYFDFSPYVVYPPCANDPGTVLIGHRDSAGGRGPFTWQLIEPAGVQRPIQSSDTFDIAYPGTYQIRCIDACGTVRLRSYDVYSYSNSYLQLVYYEAPYFVHCDSVVASGQLSIGGSLANLAFPLSLIVYDTHGGTVRIDVPTRLPDTILPLGNGRFLIGENYLLFTTRLAHVLPGDPVSFQIRDGCGTVIQGSDAPPPKSLTLNNWDKIPDGSCGTMAYLPHFSYSMPIPSQWILIADQSNTIVDSSSGGHGITLHPSGRNYTFIVFDQCGDTLRQHFNWVNSLPPDPAYVYTTIKQNSCLDSTASVEIGAGNFGRGAVVKILSGPAYAHSSKPGFSYQAHITYPYISPNSSYLSFGAMPAGHYTYEVSDSCGNFASGSFDITPQQLTDFMHQLSSDKHCTGGGNIRYRYSAGTPADNLSVSYTIRNISTGQVIDSSSTYGGNGSALLGNVPPGTYVVRLEISSDNNSLADHSDCPVVYDTVVVPDYTFPDMPVVSYAPGCFGEATITAQMDTALGVPSYTYQIIDGPMLSSMQVNQGSFQVTQTGIYTVLGLDACGNGLVRHISVDSLYRDVPIIRHHTDTCFHAIVRDVLYTESTIVSDTLRTAIGCDSIILVDTIVIRGSHDRQPLIAQLTDTFCAGAGGDVEAVSGYGQYLWDNGDTTSIIHVSDSGWYRLMVTDTERCTLTDEIHIALLDSPSVVSGWVYEDSVCLDDPLQIHLMLSGPDVQYSWSDQLGSSLQRQFADSGTYIFTVVNTCAAKTYLLHTIEKNCEEHAYPPNAFSPNGDGVNDIYRIYSSYDFASYKLMIFDRWGEKVFESDNEARGWDGRYRGEELPTGVYVYEYIGVWPTGHTHTSRGSITLIR